MTLALADPRAALVALVGRRSVTAGHWLLARRPELMDGQAVTQLLRPRETLSVIRERGITELPLPKGGLPPVVLRAGPSWPRSSVRPGGAPIPATLGQLACPGTRCGRSGAAGLLPACGTLVAGLLAVAVLAALDERDPAEQEAWRSHPNPDVAEVALLLGSVGAVSGERGKSARPTSHAAAYSPHGS